MGIVFKNNAKTTLSSGVNDSTTTIPVTEGSVFPAADLAGSGTFFLATLDDTTNNEIVKVTTCSGNSGNINLTVVRAQEGTTARAFSSGDQVELRFTAGTIDHIRSDTTVHTNIFTTANDSTTAFTLNQSVVDENDLVVFIDGVFQAHNTYTVSGTTLTLATAPASGRVVTAYSIKGLRSATNVAIATMTGDNSDTTLTLPIEPINENSVQVFFDGVYQNKSTFSISGTTLTFSTAPPTGVEVEAILLTQTNIDTAAILKDADGDTKVQVEESSDEDKIRFTTGGTERAIIDSTGIGIGTSSPSRQLTVFHPTNATHDIKTSDANLLFNQSGHNSYIGNSSVSGFLQLFTNNGNATVTIDVAGHVTMPQQTAVLVTKSTSQLNIAIDTTVTHTFDSEVFDANGDFASNTFTAPVTGKYLVCLQTRWQNIPTNINYIQTWLATSNGTRYMGLFGSGTDLFNAEVNYYRDGQSLIIDMDANDTFTVSSAQSGGSQQTDIGQESYLSVALLS